MYRESNITRKRKTLGVMLISEESKAKLRARLDSEGGRRCLKEFAKLLEDWAAEMLPAEILRALESTEAHEVIDELCPDVVNAYFKARLSPPRE